MCLSGFFSILLTRSSGLQQFLPSFVASRLSGDPMDILARMRRSIDDVDPDRADDSAISVGTPILTLPSPMVGPVARPDCARAMSMQPPWRDTRAS